MKSRGRGAELFQQLLPLVGGCDHDWNTILTHWDLLQYDTRMATALKVAGWIGIAAVCAWVLWRAWQDRRRPAVHLDCVTCA